MAYAALLCALAFTPPEAKGLVAVLLSLTLGFTLTYLDREKPIKLWEGKVAALAYLTALGTLPNALIIALSLALGVVKGAPTPPNALTTLLVVISEEVFFRQYLFTRVGKVKASLMYAAFHAPLSSPQYTLNFLAIAPVYALLGLTLQEVCARHGLLGSAACHLAYDVLARSYALEMEWRSVAAAISSHVVALAIAVALPTSDRPNPREKAR